jgi:hypothetical protein
MKPRRFPQAPPSSNATHCPGKLFSAANNDEESEQEYVSTEPKKKVQLGIMSFYEKKPKKHGQECCWLLLHSPQRNRKWRRQRLVIGINKLITATQQWLPHHKRQWNFMSPQMANFQLKEMLC